MDYMTLKEAAEKWGVTPRRVNYYCAAGRIPGAVKMAGVWLIPKNAEKPIDGRTKQRKGRERNGKEANNQRRANRCKKSTLSRVAHTRSYNSIRQDVLSFYGKLRRKPKPTP